MTPVVTVLNPDPWNPLPATSRNVVHELLPFKRKRNPVAEATAVQTLGDALVHV